MTHEQFEAKVKDFAHVQSEDYMRGYVVVFDLTEGVSTAVVLFEDHNGGKWRVPMRINPDPNVDDIAIDTGDPDMFYADAGGLFCFLWCAALERLAAYE